MERNKNFFFDREGGYIKTRRNVHASLPEVEESKENKVKKEAKNRKPKITERLPAN